MSWSVRESESQCYLADGGHHVLVLLSAQQLLHTEVQLLQQLLVSWQAERRAQPGQQLAQLVPGRQVSRETGEQEERLADRQVSRQLDEQEDIWAGTQDKQTEVGRRQVIRETGRQEDTLAGRLVSRQTGGQTER